MKHQPISIPRHRWLIIGSLTWVGAIQLTIFLSIGLLLPDISEELGLSPSEQGWLGASVLLANLFLAIPLGTLLSRFRPWRIVMLMAIGAGVFSLMQGWSPTIAWLLLGRIGAGLCFTGTIAPRALLFQQWTPPHRLPITNGVWFAGVDSALGVAFFMTPFLLDWLGGWREVFYLWGGIALAGAVIWLIFGKERSTREYQERIRSQTRTPLVAFLRYPEFWVLGIGMAGSQIGYSAIHIFWPTLAEKNLGLSLTTAGAALGISAMGAGFIDFFVNAVPTLVRRQPLVLAISGLATVGVYVGLLYSESEALTILLGLAEGISRAYFPVLFVMIFLMPNIKPREVSVGIAFIETSIWVGSAIGPLLVGFIHETTGDLRLGLLIASFSPISLLVPAVFLQVRRWSPMAPTRGDPAD